MMMGGGFNNRPVTAGWGGAVLDYAQASSYLRASESLGRADTKGRTATFSGSEVTIDMVAAQPGYDDATFEVHGVANPTLIVSLGAVVHMNLVNMDYGDNMEHGVIITPADPPYGYMSMMQIGRGLAGVMPLLPWRGRRAPTGMSARPPAMRRKACMDVSWYVQALDSRCPPCGLT